MQTAPDKLPVISVIGQELHLYSTNLQILFNLSGPRPFSRAREARDTDHKVKYCGQDLSVNGQVIVPPFRHNLSYCSPIGVCDSTPLTNRREQILIAILYFEQKYLIGRIQTVRSISSPLINSIYCPIQVVPIIMFYNTLLLPLPLLMNIKVTYFFRVRTVAYKI